MAIASCRNLLFGKVPEEPNEPILAIWNIAAALQFALGCAKARVHPQTMPTLGRATEYYNSPQRQQR
ncbi:unnamed protein product [Echinostoma caproni]|uniref:Oxidoreductase n=1 Tax=Echinostoma caproni TaxID=27848 RepID=A0A183A433_9TREM|nr:unnamed protein product [Echinostoma caproni]